MVDGAARADVGRRPLAQGELSGARPRGGLAELGGLDRDESKRLAAFARDAPSMCAGVTALGIPETIQHDDLHDGQVFVRDGRYRFLDWGDACVSHPFALSIEPASREEWLERVRIRLRMAVSEMPPRTVTQPDRA